MTVEPRTLTRKGEQTRQRIVAAAARLMFDNGVAQTRIEEVCDAAAVSNSQIYHYFSDKTALVRAVIDYQTEAVVGIQEPLFEQLDTMQGLHAWRDYALAQQEALRCRGGCPIASLAGQLAENDDAARLQLAFSFRRWSAGLRDGLARMHHAGRLRPDTDPEQLATVLLSALQGGLLLTKIERDLTPLRTALDAALDYIESHTAQPHARQRELGIPLDRPSAPERGRSGDQGGPQADQFGRIGELEDAYHPLPGGQHLEPDPSGSGALGSRHEHVHRAGRQ